MVDVSSLFDPYSRKARLFPGLLTVFPILITAIALFPSLLTSSLGATLVTICMSCGLLYALSVFARSRGKGVEKRLLAEWGGWPSTIWLRHSDDNLDSNTRARYHRHLAANVSDLSIPTAAQEARDPAKADEAYRSAVKWLQEQCRDRKHPLVEKENAEYGFRRNLRGLKAYGIAGCLAVLITVMLVVALKGSPPTLANVVAASKPVHIGAGLVDLIALFAWVFVVNDAWVRQAGDQYARALLATCDETWSKKPGRVSKAGK